MPRNYKLFNVDISEQDFCDKKISVSSQDIRKAMLECEEILRNYDLPEENFIEHEAYMNVLGWILGFYGYPIGGNIDLEKCNKRFGRFEFIDVLEQMRKDTGEKNIK